MLFGCAALIIAYLDAVRFRLCRNTLFFASGILVLLLALLSPLDTLGETYLFSAHLLQHLLLVVVVPPLVLAGVPEWLARRLIRSSPLKQAEDVLRQPFMAWLPGIGMLSVWHLPVLYNSALENERLHILEYLCFLASSVVYWLPILTPLKENRLSPILTVRYLMPAGISTTLLGIFLGYFPYVLYLAYLHPVDSYGILPLLRLQWGLDPKDDQEIAGLLMWVPGNFVYLGALLAAVARWVGESQ
jgi:cytochrome c oxidase assembly factor CtaG